MEVTKKLRPSFLWICAIFIENIIPIGSVYVSTPYNFKSQNFGNGGYQNNLVEDTVFIGPEGLHLLLNITYIKTESCCDKLAIGSGNIIGGSTAMTVSGGPYIDELRFLSQGNTIWLRFTSDYSITSDGFRGIVQPVNITYDDFDCGNEFNCENGACVPTASKCDRNSICANNEDWELIVISDVYNVTARHNVTSHNYDTGSYPCNLHQEEVYIAPDGLHLLLTIEYFNTEYGDYLRVGNGNVTNERNILLYDQGRFYNEIRVLSEENIMWLTFTSDSYYNNDGFSGFVEPVNMTLDELDCGNDFNCKNGACISQRSVCDNLDNCANGFDTIGFNISDVYNVTARHTVTSHNYDAWTYPCNLYQEEVYIAPDGLHLLLTIDYFNTYYGGYLRVGNGNVTNERNILLYDQASFNNEIRVLSEENAMWLTYTSINYFDGYGGFSGFVEPVNITLDELHCGTEFNCQNGACIPHISGCDNEQNCANGLDTIVTLSETTYVNTSYNVSSYMFDSGGYPCKLQQEEVFIAPDGHNILLTIEYLFTEELYDVLRIGNGNDIKQGLLREYSGGPFVHEIEILSEGTMMWLTLIADGSINSIGFRGFVKSVNATADTLLCAEPHPPDELVSHIPDLPEGELYLNGTEIIYECPKGWDSKGNDGAVCLYGEWTSEDAFCEAASCNEPLSNDTVVLHSPDLPEEQLYPNGTKIMYECPEGWKLNGNDSAVCLYGEWTSEDAFCEALPCTAPHPPDELVSHIPDLPDGELYLNGTEIMYECPDGWNLNGNTKAVCLYGMWTNENAFCSEILPTMCPFQSLSFSGVQLTFRATYPGSHVNSIQNCSEESSNAYQPLAMRFCDQDKWEEPVLTSCYTPEDAADVVERIANTTVTEENVNEVASDLALVTTQTEDLDVSQVEDVAESLRDIANVNSSSPEVTESVVGTVNNLMEVNERSLEQTVESSSVIVSLEQQISNVQKNPNNFTDVQHNVGVQAVKLDPDITKAVTFINLPPSNITGRDVVIADLAEENTWLFNNKQEVRTDNSTTSIYVPSKILELALKVDPTITHVPISFFIYKDSRLFQTSQASSTSAPEKDNIKNRQEIASQVIAATLEVANVVVKDLPPEDSIVTRFTIAPHLGQNEVVKEEKCVFWSVSEDGKQGTWSAEGCTLTKDKNQTVCTCNHLTSFAVLVGIGSDLPEALSIITVVGSSLSISGLILCISSLSLIGGLRTKQASQIHLNLCLCLLAFYVVFLVGDFVIDKPRHCKNIATTIHYLCLTTVAWMSVEALHMYLLFVKFKTPKLFQLKLKYFVSVSAVSVYGLCLIPVLSVLYLSSQEVDGYCFLPSGQGLLFGLILEVLVMVLFNLVVFGLLLRNIVFRPIMSSNAKGYKKKEMFSRLQQFVVFWFLLGMSWTFGFLAMIPNRESVVFEYLFCLFTSLQGFFLFIFICLKNPEVVNRFKKTRAYLSEWSNEKNKSSLKTFRTGESNSTQRAAQSSEL